MRKTRIFGVSILAGLSLAASAVSAASALSLAPAQLDAVLQQDGGALLVDIRRSEHYRSGSIPGAINIPEAFLARRAFPPLAAIVLLDDGLGAANARVAAQSLAARLAAQVYWLDGGYAAWLETGAANTAPAGLQAESLPRITYQQLVAADLTDAVLFDLRTPVQGLAPASGVDAVQAFAASKGLSLSHANPLQVLSRPSAQGGMAPASRNPLVILIDENDGEAEKTARILRANGHHRVVILTGGAEIIRHEGRPGKLRQSSGLRVEATADQLP